MAQSQTTEISAASMTISQVMTFLPEFLLDEGNARVPLCITGHHGIGKTQLVEWACAQVGAKCHSWMRLSQMDAIDIRGMPNLKDSNGTVQWFLPDWFPETGVKTVLLFDELGHGLPSVQAATMPVVLEFRVGKAKLPDDTYIIAATNPEGSHYGTHRLLAPLASRFTHIDLAPDVISWCKWALGTGTVDPAIVAYIRFRPDALHEFDAKLRSSPNPRAWERTSKIYQKHLDPTIQFALICGTVGEGRGRDCTAFLDVWRKGLPDLDAILMAPKLARVPEALDVQVAIATGLSLKASQHNLEAIMQYTERLGPELDMYTVSGAIARDEAAAKKEDRPPQLSSTLAYQQWAIKNQHYHI